MLPMIAMIVLMAAITAFIGWMLAYLWRDPEGYVNWVRRYSITNKSFDGALYRRMAWISLPLALSAPIGMHVSTLGSALRPFPLPCLSGLSPSLLSDQ